MDIRQLKDYIYTNDYIEQILQSIGCHHIRRKAGYYQCANKDGDNITAVCVYENENLTVVDYTRKIIKSSRATDIIDLVCYNQGLSFGEGLKYICQSIGISYYHDFNEELPASIQFLDLIDSMNTHSEEEKDIPLNPIDKDVLNYYKPYVNDLFYNDGIDYQTQREFGIGYDEQTNRITIPIYSDVGDLVGVKGRLFKEEIGDDEQKYLYLMKCNRSQILYGLNKTENYIKSKGIVYVFESEKSVMQCWSMGIMNTVATGGKKVSKHQIEMLTRLGVKIIFCFDKDVEQAELEDLADRFVEGINIFAIIDKDNILNEKESPSDNSEKFTHLVKNNIYMIR